MDVRLTLNYCTPKGTEATFYSNAMPVAMARLIAEDLEKTGRVKHFTYEDKQGSIWTHKEIKRFVEEIKEEPHNINVYFDGGYDQETKQSGLGLVIYYEQNNRSMRIRKNALVEELGTNNEAEYAALHLGLKELELLGVNPQSVKLLGDSKVVINQLNGEWPCLDGELNKWGDRIEHKLEQLGITLDFIQITRKENDEADQLATQALNHIEISSTIELSKR